MECPSLTELIDHLGDDAPAGVIGEHIAACAACRERLNNLRAMREQSGLLLGLTGPSCLGDCPGWEDLAAFAESGSADDALRRHLSQCESCLLRIAELRLGLGVEPANLPAVESRLLRRALAQGEARPPRLWLRFALPATAVALATVAVLVVVRGPGGPRPSPPTAARSAAPKVAPPGAGAPAVGPGSGEPELVARARIPQLPGQSESIYRSLPQGRPPVSVTFRYESPAGVADLPVPSDQRPILFSSGKYALRLRVDSPVWLYVFQTDARGKVSVLFPNVEYRTGSNPIQPAEGRLLPVEGRWYELDNAVGEEVVYVVFGPGRLEVCERLARLAGSQAVQGEALQILQDLARTSVPAGAGRSGHTVITQKFDHRERNGQ